MDKLKKVEIINVISIITVALIILTVNFILQFNRNGIMFASFMVAIIGVINLIFMCIKEAVDLNYDSKRYTLIMNVTHVLIGILLKYVFKYIKVFYAYKIYFWLLLIGLIVVTIIIFYILNFYDNKVKSNTKGPKFLVNNK